MEETANSNGVADGGGTKPDGFVVKIVKREVAEETEGEETSSDEEEEDDHAQVGVKREPEENSGDEDEEEDPLGSGGDQEETEGILSEEEQEEEMVPVLEQRIEVQKAAPVNLVPGVTTNGNSNNRRPKPPRSGFCTKCNIEFATTSLYELHLSTEHPIDRPYPCRHCGKAFKRGSERNRHEKIHNPKRFEGEPQFQCSLCPTRFHLQCSLQTHFRRVHLGQKLPGPSNIKAPVTQHHSTTGTRNPLKVPKIPTPRYRPKWQQGQPCPCTICGKVFQLPNKLRLHMTLHTGEKPHECPTCGTTFRLNSSLKQHIKVYHDTEVRSNPMKLYKCRICGKDDFLLFSSLRGHRITVHGHIPYDSEKAKPFACGVCGKPYFLRENAIICAGLGHDPAGLLRDMFRFCCPECPREKLGFWNLYLLKRHWEEEHAHLEMPTELEKNITVKPANEDLPKCKINKQKSTEWRTNGIPEEILESETPFYIELPLLPIPEEERFKKGGYSGSGVSRMKSEPGGQWECTRCNLWFASASNLRRHNQTVHDPNRKNKVRRTYQCFQCCKMFWKVATLKAHERTHNYYSWKKKEKKPYIPTGRKVGRPRKVDVIKKEEEDDDNDKYDDNLKDESQELGRRRPFYKEEKVAVNENTKTFKCKFCVRKFAKLRAVTIHQLRAHVKPWSSGAIKKKRMGGGFTNYCKVKRRVYESVNVQDANAVNAILNYQTVRVSLLKWNFPQGMIDRCRAEYGLD